MKNPKPETRNPKQIRISKSKAGVRRTRSDLECGGPPPLFSSTGMVCPAESAGGLFKTCRLVLAFCLLNLVLCSPVFAQYSIDWHTTDGGGGTSTGGVYSVTGTIGQLDASGPITGGNYSLTGGFWALISVVQTPGAPALFIMHSGNTVTIHWQDVLGRNLQQNTDLTTANWTASSGVTTSNGTNYLNLTSPTGNLFFRLTHQ